MDRENGSTFNTSIPYPSYLLISVALGLLAMSLIHPVPYTISIPQASVPPVIQGLGWDLAEEQTREQGLTDHHFSYCSHFPLTFCIIPQTTLLPT